MKRIARILLSMLIVTLCACSSGGSDGGPAADVPGVDTPAAGDIGGPPDGVADRTAGQDTVGPAEIPPGYLEFCITDADCTDWGLSCYSLGPADPTPICSQACAATADCPDYMICKAKGDDMICQRAGYCDACDAAMDCGGDMVCMEDEGGGAFCSSRCNLDDLDTCPPGHYCKKSGTGIEDYSCFPLFGTCRGDGSHCTPCQGDVDCQKGLICHSNETTAESYCATICQTDQECAKGFGCTELPGEEFQLCTLEIEGEPVETCYKGNKEFCDPCMADYECETGVCYQYAVENKFHCAFECDLAQWPGNLDGCPPGLFCVPNHGPSAGAEVCVPPGAWGCQGFLNCLGVDCPKGESCSEGFCEPK